MSFSLPFSYPNTLNKWRFERTCGRSVKIKKEENEEESFLPTHLSIHMLHECSARARTYTCTGKISGREQPCVCDPYVPSPHWDPLTILLSFTSYMSKNIAQRTSSNGGKMLAKLLELLERQREGEGGKLAGTDKNLTRLCRNEVIRIGSEW